LHFIVQLEVGPAMRLHGALSPWPRLAFLLLALLLAAMSAAAAVTSSPLSGSSVSPPPTPISGGCGESTPASICAISKPLSPLLPISLAAAWGSLVAQPCSSRTLCNNKPLSLLPPTVKVVAQPCASAASDNLCTMVSPPIWKLILVKSSSRACCSNMPLSPLPPLGKPLAAQPCSHPCISLRRPKATPYILQERTHSQPLAVPWSQYIADLTTSAKRLSLLQQIWHDYHGAAHQCSSLDSTTAWSWLNLPHSAKASALPAAVIPHTTRSAKRAW
jgi:hypothetical protein